MSRLLENSEAYRKKLLASNIYKQDDSYEISHANATSDGDEKGRGEKSGEVGTKTDIKERKSQQTFNKYNKEKPYNIENA